MFSGRMEVLTDSEGKKTMNSFTEIFLIEIWTVPFKIKRLNVYIIFFQGIVCLQYIY
jgi:hypothetical protein